MANSKSVQYADNQLARFDPKYPQIGIVMDNRDPFRTGRLKIWILNSQSTKDDKSSWITANYLAPFAGRTPGRPNATSYQQFPKGYGFWAVPPDVGTTVAVFFANGNIYDAWWFGGAYDEKMNSMVPGSATQKMPSAGYDSSVPITDYDRNSIESRVRQKYVNVPLVDGLKKQNLLYDDKKGVPNRSSTRQTTSTVYGMSSPRGSCFIIDDGFLDSELTAPSWDDEPDSIQDTQFDNPVNDTAVGKRKNEGIILRTRSGAQFLLSESEGNVFIINRDGTARIEMTPDGQITAHSDKSISIRTGEDFNLNATRDINFECGRDFNLHVQNDTKLNLIKNFNATVGQQVVINTGAELRLVSSSNIRVQSGESVNITAGSTLNTKSTSDTNMKASAFNISSSGTNMSITSTIDSSSVLRAPNVVTPQASFNDHNHKHKQWVNAENHSDEIGEPFNGGGSPSANSASDALPANDVKAVVPEQKAQEAVQYINSTPQMAAILEQDMIYGSSELTYQQSYEGLYLFMPCTGTIREFGYWGKDVPTKSGTTANRAGWLIQAKGDVVAPDDGVVTRISSGGVIVTHYNGYKSIFYELDVTAKNQDVVKKGQKIGTANGSLVFEIRTHSANVYGFSGSVDPGLFYAAITGTGNSAANKSLTVGKSSQTQPANAPVSSANSSELVVITSVPSIGSSYSQRGSSHQPSPVQPRTDSSNNIPLTEEELSKIDKTPIDWVIVPSDPKLNAEIIQFEGPIPLQTKWGYYRNGKFYPYDDTEGKATIGYGHLILPSEDFSAGITEGFADGLLVSDLNRTVRDAQSIYASYQMKCPYVIQLTLTEMVFQLGKGGVLNFKNFLKALKENNYALAAKEMRNSLWYRQTTNRVEFMAQRVEACS